MATVQFADPRAFGPTVPGIPDLPVVSSVRARTDSHRLPRVGPGAGWGRRVLLLAPLIAVTFLAKISVPPLGTRGLGIDVPVILAATVAGLACGTLQVHAARLTMYLAMLTWLGGLQLVLGEPFSVTSVALLAALFLPLALQMRPAGHREPDAAAEGTGVPLAGALAVMVWLATLFAACGVAQFALQRLVGTTAAYPLEHLLPPSLLIQNFNALIPIVDGAKWLKANGVFFLEPSFYSQFIALGLLLELSMRNRALHVALFGVALAVSYSGTGLVVAAIGIAALVLLRRRWDLLVLGLLLVALLLVLGEASPLQPLLARAAEFHSSRSSGSARFVAWIDMFALQWWNEPLRVLFGAGAGSFASQALLARQPTAEMSFAKVLFEYGITGALLFFGFLVHAFNSVRAPLAFRLGLCSTLLVNGALVAFPVGIAASVLLWPAVATRWIPREAPAPTSASEQRESDSEEITR